MNTTSHRHDRWASEAVRALLRRCMTEVALRMEGNAEILRKAQTAAVQMRWAREATRLLLGRSMTWQAIEYEAVAVGLRRWCRACM